MKLVRQLNALVESCVFDNFFTNSNYPNMDGLDQEFVFNIEKIRLVKIG